MHMQFPERLPRQSGAVAVPYTQHHPDNNVLFRFFGSLPTRSDPAFPFSCWSSRVDIPPYPPSTATEMKMIQLRDLELGGRNNGKRVLVKVSLPPKHLDAMHILIEDETGKWVMLQFFDCPYINHPVDRIAPGQLMLIKEPYYYIGQDGLPAIRVDHAMDITFLAPDHSLVPERWRRRDIEGLDAWPKVLYCDAEIRMKWKKYHQAIDM
ncbi:hypothetical protein ABW19_dt0201741 [Dactylella cylindrospora]|nr:hypothetical protein ABW19_dt0201741 [Dactylella cylindrospora]